MLTQNELKQELHYNKDTGLFTKIKSKGNKSKGSIVGTVSSDGYVYIRILHEKYGKSFKAHRLAWLYVYGTFPNDKIDHINRVKSDNRISNLREVTQLENCQNKTVYENNTSGVVGVKWNIYANRWEAQINVDKKRIYLGKFTDFSDAVNARKNAEVLYGFHNSNKKDK